MSASPRRPVGYVPKLKSERPVHYALYVFARHTKSVLTGIEKRGLDALGKGRQKRAHFAGTKNRAHFAGTTNRAHFAGTYCISNFFLVFHNLISLEVF